MIELNILLTTAVTIAVIHTLIGIDHYIPFIALSHANGWSFKKTMLVVFFCGAGHVAGSVLLGYAGIALSTGVSLLVDIESVRGLIATYFLIAFGLVYMIYGIRRAVKNKTHSHVTPDGHTIIHAHSKHGEHHKHSDHAAKKTPNVLWGLFILFVLGPCEPLIPILMYPAATQDNLTLLLVVTSFAFCTIATMLLMTGLGLKGVRLLKIGKLEQYSHALAGAAVFLCGVSLLALPI